MRRNRPASSRIRATLSVLPLLLAMACAGRDAPAAAPGEATTASPNMVRDLSLTRLDGTPLDASEWVGKAVVFVNVASACGYTRQYEGLQALYEARKAEDVVVVGVPCNQFGGQEPGTAEEIATFCKTTYGVTFPMLAKQDVNGSGRSALYKQLIGNGDDIGWNFEKIVVGRNGAVVARFPSSTKPGSDKLASAITTALAAK